MNHGACGHSCRPALCEPKENDPRVTRGWALIREDRDGTRGKDLPQEGETCALRPAFGPGHQPCARPKLCGGGGRPGMRRAVRRGLGTVPGGGRLGSTMKDELTRRRGKTGALPRAASPLQLLASLTVPASQVQRSPDTLTTCQLLRPRFLPRTPGGSPAVGHGRRDL